MQPDLVNLNGLLEILIMDHRISFQKNNYDFLNIKSNFGNYITLLDVVKQLEEISEILPHFWQSEYAAGGVKTAWRLF